jgi:hypothetical protein
LINDLQVDFTTACGGSCAGPNPNSPYFLTVLGSTFKITAVNSSTQIVIAKNVSAFNPYNYPTGSGLKLRINTGGTGAIEGEPGAPVALAYD